MIFYPIHSVYLANLPTVLCFSLQVAYISTDILQMLVALIFSPHVANELAWKQLFSGNMTYDSRQNAFNTDE